MKSLFVTFSIALLCSNAFATADTPTCKVELKDHFGQSITSGRFGTAVGDPDIYAAKMSAAGAAVELCLQPSTNKLMIVQVFKGGNSSQDLVIIDFADAANASDKATSEQRASLEQAVLDQYSEAGEKMASCIPAINVATSHIGTATAGVCQIGDGAPLLACKNDMSGAVSVGPRDESKTSDDEIELQLRAFIKDNCAGG